MTVRDAMTKQFTTCRLDTNLAAATALMWENDCCELPVLAETGGLAGVLTDRDICIALGTRNVRASELTARDVIEPDPLICTATDDIRSAIQTMREAKIRQLAVVNEQGVLEGIVSLDRIVLSEQPGDGEVVSLGDVLAAMQAISTRPSGDPISSHSAAA
jgi:CBS domain-containing protein